MIREKELRIKEWQIERTTQIKKLEEKQDNLIIFMSYSNKDRDLFKINQISEKLTKFEEIQNVIFYEGESYDNFVKYMNDYLGKCDLLLLFCSPNSLKSEFVEKEWTAVDAMSKPIVPIFVKTAHIPPLLKSRLGVEFDTFDLDITINEIYEVILKKVGKRLIDIKDLKTDF